MNSSDAELATAAAEAGADVARRMFGETVDRVDKSPTDFATAADLEAERAILDVIRSARPDDALLGEESGQSGSDDAERTWLVDPLCGTLNYAARTPLVAVNVALREGTDVRVAAVADPFAGEVFWTDGDGVSVRRAGVDTPLRPSAETHLVDLNLDAPHPVNVDERMLRLLGDPGFAESLRPRVLSTTLALAWVAGGQRAAYVTNGRLRDSVHFSSGIALCRAAGCVVTGISGESLHTGPGGLIAAADEETHAVVLAAVRRTSADGQAGIS